LNNVRKFDVVKYSEECNDARVFNANSPTYVRRTIEDSKSSEYPVVVCDIAGDIGSKIYFGSAQQNCLTLSPLPLYETLRHFMGKLE
jgi:hypothetical protein